MADVMQPPKGGEPDTPEQKKPVPLVNDGLSPSDVEDVYKRQGDAGFDSVLFQVAAQ